MNNYKKIMTESRLEAGYLMTEKQIGWCNGIIHTAAVACGVCGAIPIPVVDALPISTAQITMVISLGKVFEQKITESAAKSIITAAASTLIGRAAVKFIPVVGWITSAGVAAGVTEAMGWTIAVDFAKKHRTEYKFEREKQENAERKAEYENFKKNGDINDDVEINDL